MPLASSGEQHTSCCMIWVLSSCVGRGNNIDFVCGYVSVAVLAQYSSVDSEGSLITLAAVTLLLG